MTRKVLRLARLRFVGGRTDTGMGEVLAQLLDVLFCTFIAMVRMVQDKLNAIEQYPKTGAMGRFYCCP